MEPTASEWPAEFLCPISRVLMADPVIVSTGETYERRCIEAWLELGQTQCVKKMTRLDPTSIIPNHNLRIAIASFIRARSGIQSSVPSPPSRHVALHFAHRRLSELEDSVASAPDHLIEGDYYAYGFRTDDHYRPSTQPPNDSSGIDLRRNSNDSGANSQSLSVHNHRNPGHESIGQRSELRNNQARSRGDKSAIGHSGSGFSSNSDEVRRRDSGIGGTYGEIEYSNASAGIEFGANEEINSYRDRYHAPSGISASADDIDRIRYSEIGGNYYAEAHGINYLQNQESNGEFIHEIDKRRFEPPPLILPEEAAADLLENRSRIAMTTNASMPRRTTTPWQGGADGTAVVIDEEFLTPLVTRPSSYAIADDVHLHRQQQQQSSSAAAAASGPMSMPVNLDSLVARLNSKQQAAAAMAELRHLTRLSPENRHRLCESSIVQAILSLLEQQKRKQRMPPLLSELDEDMDNMAVDRYPSWQIDAAATIVNLSLEKPNKVKLVREGVAPALIDLLNHGVAGSDHHAAGAIFSLAMAEENRNFLGVISVIPPLLDLLRRSRSGAKEGSSVAMEAQMDAVMALYQLSLLRMNASKIAKYAGAVSLLLDMAESRDRPSLACAALHVLYNVACVSDGRKELLHHKVLARLVKLLAMADRSYHSKHRYRSDSSSGARDPNSAAEFMVIAEQAVSVLLILCKDNSSFWFLVRRPQSAAVAAGERTPSGSDQKPADIEELLQNLVHRGSPRAQEKARALLERMRQTMSSATASASAWNAGVVRSDHDMEQSNSSAF